MSARGCEPVRVRYRVLIEPPASGVAVRGTLHGSHAGLRPVWLEPDAQLRLKDGRRLDISVTDLTGDIAEFEGTGTVPEP